ncbi:MAG: DinB family protein [Chloroflexi bacterium]|nr:DinB family protein [Chloroflexota bacterium]
MNRRRAQLIERLESAGRDYVWYLDQLSEAELHAPPGPDEWTAHQVAAHMRDTEQQVFLYRVQRLLAEAHPAVESFDQEAWNREHYSPGEPIGKIKSEFRTARRKLVRLARASSKRDWDNWATHPEYGKISLHWLIEHNYSHTLDHLAQIGRMREAGILKQLNAQ